MACNEIYSWYIGWKLLLAVSRIVSEKISENEQKPEISFSHDKVSPSNMVDIILYLMLNWIGTRVDDIVQFL